MTASTLPPGGEARAGERLRAELPPDSVLFQSLGLEPLTAHDRRESALSAIITSIGIASLLGIAFGLSALLDTVRPLGHGYDLALLHFWLVSSLGSAIPVAAATGWGKASLALLLIPAVLWPYGTFLAQDPDSSLTLLCMTAPFWGWAGIMLNAGLRLRNNGFQ